MPYDKIYYYYFYYNKTTMLILFETAVGFALFRCDKPKKL